MSKKFLFVFVILCSFCFALGQKVALSGIVKLNDGKPVEGARISLKGIPNLSTLTKEDGTFSLKNSISVNHMVVILPKISIWFQGNTIFFNSPLNTYIEIGVYTPEGRIISSENLHITRTQRTNRIKLPLLGSGIYYMVVRSENLENIFKFLQIGHNISLVNDNIELKVDSKKNRLQKSASSSSVVDTLIAEKSGYVTSKYPLNSYEQDKIEFILDIEDNYSGNINNLKVRSNPNSVLSAYVSWNTDKPAISKVQFGKDSLEWEIVDEKLVTQHEVLVIGMRAQTKYRICAISGLAKSETTFTTGVLPNHIPIAEVDINEPELIQPGWTLMNVQRGDGQPNAMSNAPPTAVAYDLEGYPVWYFVNGTINERGGAIPVQRTDKGVLIGPTLSHSPVEVDWAGNVLWSCSNSTCGGQQISHHAGKLSNGNYIVQEDLNGMSDHCWREFTVGNDKPVHSICLSDAVSGGGGTDWAHGNSITVDLEQDVAYLSLRWLGIIKMKYSTKQRIWHLPASYATTHNIKYSPSANMKFIPPESQFSDIHDPEIHDDGTILVFDNGGYTGRIEEGNPANLHTRVLEYAIDEKAQTATLVWEWPGKFNVDNFYRTDYYVPFWGDANRLPNGNVLIAAGRSGSAPKTPASRVTEVSKKDGKVVWELRMPKKQGVDYGIYRAERIYPLPLVKAIAGKK